MKGNDKLLKALDALLADELTATVRGASLVPARSVPAGTCDRIG